MIRFANEAWQSLEAAAGSGVRSCDVGLLEALPEPARRFLSRAVPEGLEPPGAVALEMTGEIRIGRWRPFRAVQILRPGRGFVWAPTVGSMPFGFVGADVLTADEARMEFRFGGVVPVVRSSGADIRLSARGRLAAETAAWAPWALFPDPDPESVTETGLPSGEGPGRGAVWSRPGGDGSSDRVTASVPADGHTVDVDLTVDPQGRPLELCLQRWRDSGDPPGWAPFGSSCESEFVLDNGMRICGSGTVGWDWGTADQGDGEFFRYRITGAEVMP